MGGVTPRWRRDGKELFYVKPSATGGIMAVDILRSAPSEFQISAPQTVFRGIVNGYDVSPDGQHFVIDGQETGDTLSFFTVLLNWKPKN